MDYFAIEGGHPINGEIAPQGNKNEALPVLCASILTDQKVTLRNLPLIQDIHNLGALLTDMGCGLGPINSRDIEIENNPTEINGELDSALSSSIRGSITLLGPLVARLGEIYLPRPGGDRIGRRRLDTHFLALSELGADISVFHEGYRVRADQLKGRDILLDEASVTATENAVMAASLAKGKTIIRNAASEPHVQGLCRMLNKMGARIQGIGSNILEIDGVKELGGVEHTIGADYLEVGSFICLAAATGGNLKIKDVTRADMRMILKVFETLGIIVVWEGQDIIVPPNQKMKIRNDVHEAIGKIDDAPWPGFPADMVSIALVAATQCEGTILIHEKMFESRLFFVDKLIGMGAKIVLCDPHRAVVIGPSKLHGAKLTSPDIRAGMALLIAALAAEGPSEINNIIQIDRGYEDLEKRLRPLGARIERRLVD